MYKIKRFSKILDKVKNKVDAYRTDAKGEFKKDRDAVIKFAKENPQDFAIYGASYVIPGTAAWAAKKAGKKKLAAGFAALTAAPLGTGGIALRHAYLHYKDKKRKKS